MKKIIAVIISIMFIAASFLFGLFNSEPIKTGKGNGYNAKVNNITEFSYVLRDISDTLNNLSSAKYKDNNNVTHNVGSVAESDYYLTEDERYDYLNQVNLSKVNSISIKESVNSNVVVRYDGETTELHTKGSGEIFFTESNLYADCLVSISEKIKTAGENYAYSLNVDMKIYIDADCFMLKMDKFDSDENGE